ncbi:hypothetical protein [Pseudoalteromonas umbrosa]|uniref:hypothetical protein n=1 Tax=Pseudoalteromonas umbrosa TaxID=3048489 RepID=UPI0024C2869C|nr:hypothetical protein [Pseudoalteromonas sp. B95]MDK1285742.1 hypothetical protein [Pseudoalteromonas sp. B95]
MSNSIVISSKYVVTDPDSFKASLTESLGSEANLQKSIKSKLEQVAQEAKESMPQGGKVSIDSMIKTEASNGNEPIQLDVKDNVSTLTVSESFNLTLEVIVTDALTLDSDVNTKVSYTKSYPLSGQSVSGIANVITALNTFPEGKKFDNELISVELKPSDTNNSQTNQ